MNDYPKSRPALPFGEVANHYDRGRPGYPETLVDDVLDDCDSEPRVLEVGAGTGRATELFARRNLEVRAIEPSPEMAAVARSKCAEYPRVSVLTSGFEDWPSEPGGFDLVFSAQAWHWITPGVRYQKAHEVLRPSGNLALFWNQPLWEESEVAEALAEVYMAHAPELYSFGPWFPGFKGPYLADRPSETEVAGFFDPFTERLYRWAQDYTTSDYLDLVQSLPEHLSLPVSRYQRLLDGLAEVVGGAGGELRIEYETRLYSSRPTI